jgi:hypothetical protein
MFYESVSDIRTSEIDGVYIYYPLLREIFTLVQVRYDWIKGFYRILLSNPL